MIAFAINAVKRAALLYNNKQQITMKKFTKQEILELYGQVTMGEISFSRMVEVMNQRVSEAEDIPEGLKKGDLAIFWDDDKGSAFIGEYNCFLKDVKYPYRDNRGNVWVNAIKFESIEQYEKLLKGEK